MIATTMGLAWIVAQSAVGWHDRDRAPRIADRCDECGVEKAVVLSQIVRLQSAPKWRAREDAAHTLRRVDWRCHPEVLGALAFSLLNDCEDEVREEAAESLTKMAACVPVVHEALSRAASADPDGPTRRKARRGLRKLARQCGTPCAVCGPTTIRVVPPAGPLIGPTWTEPLDVPDAGRPPPGPVVVPPADLSPLPPIDSSVPRSTAPEIEPLPSPGDAARPGGNDDGLAPLPDKSVQRANPRPTTRVNPARPRVLTALPGFPWLRPYR